MINIMITIKASGGKINKNNRNAKDSAIFSAVTNNNPSINVLINDKQVNINKMLLILLSYCINAIVLNHYPFFYKDLFIPVVFLRMILILISLKLL